MSSKILPIAMPIIYAYKHHGLPLSLIPYNDNTKMWTLSRFMNVYASPNFSNSNWLDYFSQFIYQNPTPWFFPQRILRKSMIEVLTTTNLVDLIVNCIDSEQCVYIEHDAYYIPHHSSYNRRHQVSNMLIYGYNRSEEIFHVLDYSYKNDMQFKELKVGFAELADSYYKMENADYHALTIISYSKETESNPVDTDYGIIRRRLEWYLDGTDYRELYRVIMNVHTNDSEGYKFGIQVYDHMDEFIQSVAEGEIRLYVQPMAVLWEHKRVLHLLGDSILAQDDGSDIRDALHKLEESALFVRNYTVRQIIAPNDNYFTKITSALHDMRELEEKTLPQLLAKLP